MNVVKKISFCIDRKNDAEAIGKTVMDYLISMAEGDVTITLEIGDNFEPMRKKYFAMITELANFAGYVSHKDKELFKRQIKEVLQIQSIAEIKTKEEMGSAIEALHEFSAKNYDYTFDHGNENSGIISFSNK